MKKKVSEKQRRLGEFYTPTIWVDEAHKMISENLGADWKEKYVVWDPAWGTGNLTRDYKFKELYCSTIKSSDIHNAGYNPEAIKFQYDFLNDGIFLNEETGEYVIDVDMDNKLPQGLKNALLEGKPIVILMNPPYATSSIISRQDNKSKKGVAKNYTNDIMLKNNCGKSSSQLYTQFFYKINLLQEKTKNITIGVFSPTLFLSGSSFKKFRSLFNKNFNFIDGFLFDASHFSDVSKGWGISFTMFDSKKNLKDIILKVKDIDKNRFVIINIHNKIIYNLDKNQSAGNWVREELKTTKKQKNIFPHFASALKISQKENQKIHNGSLGTVCFLNNNIYENAQGVFLMSGIVTKGNASISNSILPENIFKVTSLFTARKCIMPNWINSKDEYFAPNENHPLWQQFQYDSIVYSLFHIHSFQSSLRQVEYKDKLWDIKNEFFWLSKDKMKQLAEENDFDALYQDVRTSDERYVYELLFGEQNIYNKLSPDAKSILDKATELMEKSIKMRRIMSEEHPEYHLQSWDAGYAQMKLVWKQYFKNEFDAFRALYKKFEDRMRPLVYELGFLLDIK